MPAPASPSATMSASRLIRGEEQVVRAADLDRPTIGPFLYWAVYVDEASGGRTQSLLRDVVG